jgi:adenine-specific DNA methylase
MVFKHRYQSQNDQFITDEAKIDFKGMKWHYEYELARARDIFMASWLAGSDVMSTTIQGIEAHIIEDWKDEQYKNDLKKANEELHSKEQECYDEDGFNSDKYNQFVIVNIIARWKAVNELLYRRNMAPQMAEYGVLD